MKTPASFIIFLLAALLPTGPGQAAQTNSLDTGVSQNERSILIPAGDRRFDYDGRFDFGDTNAPVVIWQASRIRLDFQGDHIVLLFDDATGQCFFDARVDNSNTIVELRRGAEQSVTLSSFGPGRHELTLFKRSEAAAGTVRFRGAEMGLRAKAWAPAPAPCKLKMEFLGDSITVGACNEDGPADQWETRRTHDSALSYAALTAAAFSADYRNIAVSGMGIATGWVQPKAGQIWDRLYPDVASPRADLSRWVPQIVFVNFGENDGSFSAAHGQPFPANFTAGYVSLVKAVRNAYPKAHIVLLRGGMSNGANNAALRLAWDKAVNKLEASDDGISHFVFTHWTVNHPRVADDRILADELVAWLKQQTWMNPWR